MSVKTKKDIIFYEFMKRIVIFLIIIWWLIFWMNFILKSMNANLFFYKFFEINEKSYVIKKDLSKSANFKEAKQWTLYILLNTLLKNKQEETKNQSLTEFEFSIQDIKEVYFKLREDLIKSTKMIWSNYWEFETLMNKFEVFQSFKILKNQTSFKAKKIFYIEKWNSSYLLDISNQSNKSYWIKIYRAINNWMEETNSKVFKDFSMRVQFYKNNKKVLYLKTKKWTEKEFFIYQNWKFKYTWLWWLKTETEKEFYKNILFFFTDVKKYLIDEKRNTFIIRYLKEDINRDEI